LKYWYGAAAEGDDIRGQRILNPGVWGGRGANVLGTLELLCDEITRLAPGPDGNCNLPVFNYVLYRQIGRAGFWSEGAPLHSVFRQHQHDADVCFVHK
jgi:hypothetical protein